MAPEWRPPTADCRLSTADSRLGLYIHIPFCSAICNYCNFNRGLFDAAAESAVRRRRFSRRSSGRGRREAVKVSRADTIYFGGGTPSLLEPAEVARIIAACREAFDVASDAEVTLEANPESVDEARLAAFRHAGVNRLSFGVQSFREEELRRLSRLHTVERARLAVDRGAPRRFRQSQPRSDDVAARAARRPVAANRRRGHRPAAPITCRSTCSRCIRTRRSKTTWRAPAGRRRPTTTRRRCTWRRWSGWRRPATSSTEISNVAKPGRRSRHNLKYWTDGEWLGFGCGAHSTRDGVQDEERLRHRRLHRVHRRADYGGARIPPDVRRRTPRRRPFTGLRLAEGMNLDAIRERYGVDVWQRYGAELADRRRRPASARRRPASPDTPGHAAGPRGNGCFRVEEVRYSNRLLRRRP